MHSFGRRTHPDRSMYFPVPVLDDNASGIDAIGSDNPISGNVVSTRPSKWEEMKAYLKV